MLTRYSRYILPLCILVLLFAVGCRPNAQVNAPSSQLGTSQMSLDDMRKGIMLGANDAGWTAYAQGDALEAKITVRGKHTVVVSIPYTANGYSIKHVSTINMDEKRDKDGKLSLHPNYNKWVNNLQQKIDSRLTEIRVKQS